MGLTTTNRDQNNDLLIALNELVSRGAQDATDIAGHLGSGTRYAREVLGLLVTAELAVEIAGGAWVPTEDATATKLYAWIEERTNAQPEPALESNVLRHPCRCGCEANTNHPESRYLPGHDARHAGAVARALVVFDRETNPGADTIASYLTERLQTPALVDKAHALFLRWSQAPATSSRKGRKPAVKTGEVKVGRWTYPTRQEGNGPVLRNTKRDGSGEWVTIRSTKQSRATS